MSSFQQNIMKDGKKQETETLPQGKKRQQTTSERTQVLNLINNDLEAAVINVFKKLNETTLEEVKENVILSHQIENIHKEIKKI